MGESKTVSNLLGSKCCIQAIGVEPDTGKLKCVVAYFRRDLSGSTRATIVHDVIDCYYAVELIEVGKLI